MKIIFCLCLIFSAIPALASDKEMDRLIDEAIERASGGLSPHEKELMREKLKPHREKINSLLKMSTEEQMKFIAEGESYLKSNKGKEQLNHELNQLSPEEREMFQKFR